MFLHINLEFKANARKIWLENDKEKQSLIIAASRIICEIDRLLNNFFEVLLPSLQRGPCAIDTSA